MAFRASDAGAGAIVVTGLTKTFRVHRRAAGIGASLRSLTRRSFDLVHAVTDVSFRIEPGEVVGFLGPNGAGKTTTLKCLAGLLHPSAGSVSVLGRVPHRRQRDFLSAITLVMGQRNQLFWDLPAMESFLVNQAIYRIGERDFRNRLADLVELLQLEDLLTKQVRTLSLGERMRCELAGSLLHRPAVLFLDEPTLGLDVAGQAAIRDFVAAYNRDTGATVLLTSHYMADVTSLARRVLVIDGGRLRHDGDLQALVERTAPYRLLRLRLSRPVADADLAGYGDLHVPAEGPLVVLRVPRAGTAAIAARVLADLPVADLAIEEPPIEETIRAVFDHG